MYIIYHIILLYVLYGCCDETIVGFFSKTEKKTFLGPGESIQYTWDDPTGTRAVHWTLANTPIGFAINVAKVSDL